MVFRYKAPPHIFHRQTGSGIPVFKGAVIQRGHGLGSLVKGLFKSAAPLLKKGALALGKEAMNTGFNVVQDALNGESLKTAVRKNASRAGKRLVNRAVGKMQSRMSGKQVGGNRMLVLREVKRKRRSKKRVIRSNRPSAKRRRVHDIFD